MSEERWADFDIHGLVGIRLVNPPPAAEEATAKQLGLMCTPLTREPDITVRFVNHIAAPGLWLLGQDRHGFTEKDFFLLTGPASEAKTKIPFDRLSDPCEIVCEEQVHEVPLLLDIIKLTFLKKDCVAVHASAFVHKGQSILLSSWAKGGKTTALLGFTYLGAKFVSDDCVLLSGDGQTMYGVPGQMEISDLHVETMPALRSKIPPAERWRVTGMRCLRKVQMTALKQTTGNSLVVKGVRRTVSAAQRHWRVRMSPQLAFGHGVMVPAPAPQKIFLLMSYQGTRVEVQPASRADVVSRLTSSTEQEQRSLAEHYLAFKYAFPNRSNPLLERTSEIQQNLLTRALAGKDTYLVRHPYPLHFPDLYEAMLPFCEGAKHTFAKPRPDLVTESADLGANSTY